jgi:excisionase family DNA binding protein
MLSVSEVAKRLGVSTALVYQLVAQGRLACYRIGLRRGAIRFSESDVEAYLDSCRIESAERMPQSRSSVRAPTLKHLHL